MRKSEGDLYKICCSKVVEEVHLLEVRRAWRENLVRTQVGLASSCVQGQSVGGRWVRAFLFSRKLSSICTSSWDWIHPERLQAHRRFLSESTGDDVRRVSQIRNKFAFWADVRSTTCVVASRTVKPLCKPRTEYLEEQRGQPGHAGLASLRRRAR